MEYSNSQMTEIIGEFIHDQKHRGVMLSRMIDNDTIGYSERYVGPYYGGYSGRSRDSRNGSGNYGGYSRNDSRYSREMRNGGYSRGYDWNEQLRIMMDEAPDEGTRMDIKKLMDKMAG